MIINLQVKSRSVVQSDSRGQSRIGVGRVAFGKLELVFKSKMKNSERESV